MARAQLVPGWSWQLSSGEGTAVHQGAVGRWGGRRGRTPALPRLPPFLELSLVPLASDVRTPPVM